MVCALWASRVCELQRFNWGLLPLRSLGTFVHLWSFLFFLLVLRFPLLVVIQKKKKLAVGKYFVQSKIEHFFCPQMSLFSFSCKS